MRVKKFRDFVRSGRVVEQSYSDFSQHTWSEAGQDSMPPNSGFEGTSAEPMDYSAGYYGENPEDAPVEIEELDKDRKKKKEKPSDGVGPKEIKAMIEGIEQRINKLESK